MDKASRVLAKGLPLAVPTSYRALADHGEVPRSTLHARAQGPNNQARQSQADPPSVLELPPRRHCSEWIQLEAVYLLPTS